MVKGHLEDKDIDVKNFTVEEWPQIIWLRMANHWLYYYEYGSEHLGFIKFLEYLSDYLILRKDSHSWC